MFRSTTSLFALTLGVAVFTAAPVIDAEAQIRGSGRTSVGQHGGGGHARPSAGARPGSRGGGVSRDNNRNASGNRNSGNRNNNNNNRVNIGNDVNINVDNDHHDHGWDWDDDYHPVARGVAFGAAAAVTSAVVGSMIYSLPPSCSPYMTSYYYCGGVYYAPQYQGDTVVYVVVDQPR